MKNHSANNWLHKVTVFAAVGVLTAVPFLSAPTPTEAQPRNDRYGRNNQPRTFTGVVARDLGGDSFELRTNNGVTIRVRMGRYDEPRSVDRGDQVQVTGRFQNNLLIASSVRFLRDTRNNEDNYFERDTLVGTVTYNRPGNNFDLRASNGRTYRVRLDKQVEPRSLDRGDRIRLIGRHGSNNAFVARRIQFLNDTRDNNSYSDTDTISSTFVRELGNNELELRNGVGQFYRVRYSRADAPQRLRRGDRIQVIGYIAGDTIDADKIRFLSNSRIR